MSTRHPLGWTVAATLVALAASGAQAVEATQWNPPAGPAITGAAHGDALHEPGAWTVGRGEATQFHDGVSRDTMRTRGEVRYDLAQAKSRGWLADTGEAGASERVWRRRAAYVRSKRDGELAAARTSADPIGAIAAIETRPPPDHGLYALAPDHAAPHARPNRTPHAVLPSRNDPALALAETTTVNVR
jgi:hypothetical protein